MSSLLSANPSVPIIGQPISLLSYTVLPLFQCNCGHPHAVVQLVAVVKNGRLGTAPAACEGCGTVYQIQGIQMVDGQLLFNLGMNAPTQMSS